MSQEVKSSDLNTVCVPLLEELMQTSHLSDAIHDLVCADLLLLPGRPLLVVLTKTLSAFTVWGLAIVVQGTSLNGSKIPKLSKNFDCLQLASG